MAKIKSIPSDWLWLNIAIVTICIFYFTIVQIEDRIEQADKRGDSGKTFYRIFSDSLFAVSLTILKVYMVLILFKYIVFPFFSIFSYVLFGPDNLLDLDLKFIVESFFSFDIFTHMLTEFMFISFTFFVIIFIIILYTIFCFNKCGFDNYMLHYKIIIYASMIVFLCIYTSYSFRKSKN